MTPGVPAVRRPALVVATALAATSTLVAVPAVGHTDPRAAAPAAQAAAPGLTVALAGVAPQVASPTTDVTLAVTVRNTGSTPVRALAARAALRPTRFTHRGALGAWLAEPAQAGGAALAVVDGTPTTTDLAPGATARVAVTVPRDRWRLGRSFAAVPVDVTVIGERLATTPTPSPSPSADGSASATATASTDEATVPTTPVTAGTRTVVPWADTSQAYVPLAVAWAVPLTLPADARLFSPSPATALDAWTAAVGPASTVRRRLAAAGSAPVTWLVDPAVVDADRFVARAADAAAAAPTPTATSPAAPSSMTPTGVTATAQPAPAAVTPRPSQSPGGPAPSASDAAGRTASAAALTRSVTAALKALPSTQTVWSLPPADPDTAALAGDDLDAATAAAAYPQGTSRLDTALGTVPRDTAWPADGLWSAARERDWPKVTHGYPMTRALVSTSTLAAATGYTPGAVNRSTGGTGLLAYDEELSDIAGGTAAHEDPAATAQVVQRFLGESLVLLGEREGTARSVVVALPRETSTSPETLSALLSAGGSAPWLRATTLPALASSLGSAPVATPTTPAAALHPASPLTDAQVDVDVERGRRLRGLAGIMPDSLASERAALSATGPQLFGSRWRRDRAAYSALAHDVDAQVDAATKGIQVSPANVNFLADAGAVAITVTNDLPYPVANVHLTLTPGNGKLRVPTQPAPLTIKARSRATVRVQVTALGSGEVPVVAQVSTPEGTPLGTPRTVTMNVRPPAEWILWVVGGLLAVVLLAGLARTLVRKPTRAVRDDLVVRDAPTAPPADGPRTDPRGDR